MDRGPMALFGAIVAVGLGPALWLGAQFGNVSVTPGAPPAVVGEQRVGTGKAPGGAGAAPQDPVTEPPRRSGYLVPMSSTPSPRPSRTAEPKATDVDEDPTTPPAGETTEPTPSDDPATAPTGDTGEPTGPPSGGDSEEPTDPAPSDPDDPPGGTADVTLAGR